MTQDQPRSVEQEALEAEAQDRLGYAVREGDTVQHVALRVVVSVLLERDAALTRADEARALLGECREALGDFRRWAESKCPCENEEPDPCPLCGASVENLEPCKAADLTLPPRLLEHTRALADRIAANLREPKP